VSNDSQTYVQWFRQASPYINAHRGKTFVVMLPGTALLDDNFANIVHDLALLNSLGVRLVLVHGARPQIEERLAKAQLQSHYHQQLRITDKAHMGLVCQAVGEVRFSIESALSTGLPNSPMHGAHIQVVSGNFVTAQPLGVIDGIDFQHTGQVRRVNTSTIHQALDQQNIVCLSPIGYSLTGELFNLCFAELATEVATALNADKLIAFTSESGFKNADGQLLRQLSLSEAQQQLQQLELNEETSQTLNACFKACQQGVSRAQIIGFQSDGALLQELFTRDGSGTLVHRDHYETVRQANIDDVGGILELIEPLERQGALVRRSRELLESEIDQFTVLEKDGTILACSALYPFDQGMAELACVATHPDYRKGGLATSVLTDIEQQARQQGIKTLFVLTTQTAHWFLGQGFVEADISQLPEQRQSLYNLQRNSKVFIKNL
jgi:amino-acid N-acetyltransferase